MHKDGIRMSTTASIHIIKTSMINKVIKISAISAAGTDADASTCIPSQDDPPTHIIVLLLDHECK